MGKVGGGTHESLFHPRCIYQGESPDWGCKIQKGGGGLPTVHGLGQFQNISKNLVNTRGGGVVLVNFGHKGGRDPLQPPGVWGGGLKWVPHGKRGAKC